MDHIFSKFHKWCPNSFVNNYLYTLMCHIGVYKTRVQNVIVICVMCHIHLLSFLCLDFGTLVLLLCFGITRN